MAQGIERTEAEALAYIEPIIPLLQRGMSTRQSCDYAGISEDSVKHYKKKFESVYLKITTAKMHLIATASDTIAKNIDDPKVALEVLKRRSKKLWGDRLDVTSDDEKLNSIVVKWAEPINEERTRDNNTD